MVDPDPPIPTTRRQPPPSEEAAASALPWYKSVASADWRRWQIARLLRWLVGGFSQGTAASASVQAGDKRTIVESTLRPSPRVLVADDDASIRELLRDILAAEGYRVTEAANGAEALALIRTDPPDAVLMDLMMPVLSGAEATVAIKDDPSTTSIPVLAMSAGSHFPEKTAAIPADAFLRKPFDLAILISTLADHTGHGHI